MKSSVLLDGPEAVSSTVAFTTTRTTDTEVALAQSSEAEESSLIPPHPLGVKPAGNQYTASQNARHSIGSFQALPDEVLIILLEHMNSACLRSLGYSCKALFAFCSSDELWRALFIDTFESGHDFKWRGSWRATFLGLSLEQTSRIRSDYLFSDVLYRPFLCAHTSLTPYTTNIPSKNSIPRLDNISAAEFSASWADRPFILTQPVRTWPIYKGWDTESLVSAYGNTAFRQESVDWPLHTYISYMNNTTDESPLYLFDRSFVEKMSLTVGHDLPNADYWIPPCFGYDFFSVLRSKRPDSRWLIIGPARSGSTFHKDPNATSAWNAVLRGSKYWIMFPSHSTAPPPPGVFVSADQSEVTSPLSIAEWLIGFHAEARRTLGCLEGICGEGEVLHVPSGWWHLVVNLEPSIAVTQNFVPESHLVPVLEFLGDKREQVSGFKKEVADPYALFVEGLSREWPDVAKDVLAEAERRKEGKKRKWDIAVGKDEEDEIKAFSFGFGGDGDSDEDIP